MKTSVVIPMYNSEKTIRMVVDEAKTEIVSIEGMDYEFILVNDFSPDNVIAEAHRLADEDSRIKVIDLAKNVGQTAAILAGLNYTTGDYIVVMDDDFQNPGNEIGRMLEALGKGDNDIVFARYSKQQASLLRKIGTGINRKMAELMIGKPKGIDTNAFFVMRAFIRNELLKYNNHYPYIFGIIFASTQRVANVDVTHRKRAFGKSNYSFRKLVSLWLNGFLNFSVKPLRIATILGIVTAFIAAIVVILLVIDRLIHPEAPLGWTSIIVAIMFFSGVQLVGIGFLGEYLGRMYISSSNLPQYVIRDIVNIEDPVVSPQSRTDLSLGDNQHG